MESKSFRATIELKADPSQVGQFVATFATLNVIDKDGDVTVPGAFQDGQQVRISAWGHNWGALPVGNGTIHADQQKAWVDGQFFLDTAAGKDTYTTVKNLGDLQEWSYGFEILKQSFGKFAERDVRFLEGLNTFEVSPVMIGAGVNTGTDAIKESKVGARNAAADAKRIQSAHDIFVELGAECASEPKGHAQNQTNGKAEDPPEGKAEDRSEGKASAPSPLALRIAAELLDYGPD